MSFYAYLTGTVEYSSKEDFNKIVNQLKKEGYIENDKFIDETGDEITACKNIDEKNLKIEIPFCFYRNLSRFNFRPGAKNLYIKGASIDGCFEGWIDTTNDSQTIDLTVYAEKELHLPPPDQDQYADKNDYYDALYEWQDVVINEFMKD